MGKNAQLRQQLNIRFTGEDKAELLNNLDAYLFNYKITKADFIAQCIQNGIDNDLASSTPVVASPKDSQVIQNAVNEAIAPIQQQLQELSQRLGKWRRGEEKKR